MQSNLIYGFLESKAHLRIVRFLKIWPTIRIMWSEGKPAPTAPPPSKVPYRGTSLIRNSAPLGPYRRTMRRVLGWSYGDGAFL